MSAPPSGFARRPAASRVVRGMYLQLALAATLLVCAAVPMAAARKDAATKHAATKHAAAKYTAARKAAPAPVERSRAPAVAHRARNPQAQTAAKPRNAEIARAEAAGLETAHGKRNGAAADAGRAPGRGTSPHLTPREALAAKAASFRSTVEAPVVAAKVEPAARTSDDVAATSATQDRVHAWMRAHGAAPASTTAAKPAAGVRGVPQPDLSTSPRKATVDDFDRAVRRQTETLRAAAAQKQRTSTAEDDAAALEESRIPSTAPTARVATPFTPGDLLGSGTPTDLTAKASGFTQQPATLTTRNPDAAALATTATAGEADVTAGPIRIVAAQTARSTTTKLQLPRPSPIVRNAPAATAVAAAAKHPKLEADVAADMADAAFASDSPSAIAALPAGKTDLVTRPTLATGKVDDDADLESTGKLTTVDLATVDLYDTRGRLRLLPAMKGTHEILVHQNQMAVADGLDRIEDDDQMYDMRRLKLLVSLPDNDAIEVNESLPANRRYARPWSVRFLNDLARAHYARFRTPLIITSAVRTVAFQRHLVFINGNAAPPTGEVASPHLYGQAVDLGKHGMSITEIAWMRAYLTPIENEGKIDVEEEFQQACFHISVYRRYLGLPTRKSAPLPDTTTSRTLQQAKSAPPPSKHRRLPSALLATGLR